MIGEYVVATSDELEVQARFLPRAYRPPPCDCSPSLTGAAAITDGESTVFIDARDQWLLTIDGQQRDLDVLREVEAGELVVTRTPRGVDVVDGNGTRVEVNILRNRLGLFVFPGEDTEWTGLLGTNDGNRDNEFLDRDGAVVGDGIPPDRRPDLYGTFADAWRLAPAESAMEYRPGESTEAFAEVPAEMREAAADRERDEALGALRRTQGEALCSLAGITDEDLIEACVFDFIATGDADFAQEARGEDIARQLRAEAASGTSARGSMRISDVRLEERRELVAADGLVLLRTRDLQDVVGWRPGAMDRVRDRPELSPDVPTRRGAGRPRTRRAPR